DHLHPVLEARNERMAGPGQPQWNHACEKCTWVTLAEDGIHHRSIHVTVTDGVTLGHPCCAVHDCQEPLYSQCDIYCVRHAHKNRECVVVECTRLREGDWKTCAGKAWGEGDEEMYVDCDGMILEEDTVLHEYEVSCAGKTAAGNQKIQARFGRQRTHNEELCVATCGVILECTTFFGSEAPNGVWLFWKGLFPMQASMLHCQFHDNNCKILPMLKNHPDPHFSHTIFPVDVFHFKSKHKESDQFCAKHCNLMNWPKLLTEGGCWRFNSSGAEQANAYFGGYQAVVREMQVDWYNFFLDEMISRRNEMLVKELAKGWHHIRFLERIC
ncbi:hypothetical protein K439DRAFT_1348921, partial [Ramaria rubella]